MWHYWPLDQTGVIGARQCIHREQNPKQWNPISTPHLHTSNTRHSFAFEQYIHHCLFSCAGSQTKPSDWLIDSNCDFGCDSTFWSLSSKAFSHCVPLSLFSLAQFSETLRVIFSPRRRVDKGKGLEWWRKQTPPAASSLGSGLEMNDSTHSSRVVKRTQSWHRGTLRKKRGEGLKGEEGFNVRDRKKIPSTTNTLQMPTQESVRWWWRITVHRCANDV